MKSYMIQLKSNWINLSEVLLTLTEFVTTYLLSFSVCSHVRPATLNPPDTRKLLRGVQFQLLNDDRVLYEWLKTLEQTGLCLMVEMPRKPGQLKRISERVAFLKKTNYGWAISEILWLQTNILIRIILMKFSCSLDQGVSLLRRMFQNTLFSVKEYFQGYNFIS